MLLSSFSCEQDPDIEQFLHFRAIEFENLSKARTYLICDIDELINKVKPLTIYGYISIALKVLSVQGNLSNRKRRELDGFSAKSKGEPINDFPCYLIGQLAKNSNIEDNPISGADLIDFSYGVISEAVSAVGGRYMMIECRDNDKLIKFYHSNMFEEISREDDGELSMVQMIRKI